MGVKRKYGGSVVKDIVIRQLLIQELTKEVRLVVHIAHINHQSQKLEYFLN